MGGVLQNLLLLTSPLGDDTLPYQTGTLHAVGLSANEQLSAPFLIALDVVSTDGQITPDRLLKQSMTVTVRRKDGTDRFFNGIVRSVGSGGIEARGRWTYRLELVPSLWFLSQSQDCRIFQQKTAVEILRQILSEHGIQPVDFRVTGNQLSRDYTTQYNESDLAFCQRLMQESGLFYYFEHRKSQHTLVVANANHGFSTMPDAVHRVMAQGDNVDIISAWETAKSVASGQATHQDYDPTRPTNPVNGKATATDPGPGGSARQTYLWPAMTTENNVALDRARYDMEAGVAQAAIGSGVGHDPQFCPGFRFQIERNPAAGGTDYVVHSTQHTARDETWLGGTTPSSYQVFFTMFDATTPWRDPVTLPRPPMPGIFSATVLGESGEELHVDHLGRIKVRPMFDHRGETVAAMAIWVRVLHPWAGNRWGWQHLPRVGTEVGISFMSGDCDNPVVVGCFYHEQNPPVFDLPGEKTKSGFRSRSTRRGGTADYNELSFDDAIGQEMMRVHAQRDYHEAVERDRVTDIARDRTETITRHQKLTSSTGNITIESNLGTVTIRATEILELVCGTSTITMTPAGIVINGANVTIASESAVTIAGEFVLADP